MIAVILLQDVILWYLMFLVPPSFSILLLFDENFMQRQISARALMPPPRPTKSFSSSAQARSKAGSSLRKSSTNHRAEFSTSSNTSGSRSGSFKARGSSNSHTGQSSNISSNSDAHKPRRKRRPKKKKQQVCHLYENFTPSHQYLSSTSNPLLCYDNCNSIYSENSN